MVGFVSRKERSLVINTLNESMDCIAVCADGSNNNLTVIIFESSRFSDRGGTAFDSFIVDTSSVINSESDIFNTVTVLCNVLRKFRGFVCQSRFKSINDLTITNNMNTSVTVAGLKSL